MSSCGASVCPYVRPSVRSRLEGAPMCSSDGLNNNIAFLLRTERHSPRLTLKQKVKELGGLSENGHN